MKVLSVLTSSSRGGAEFAAVNLLDALAERGHEALLLTDLDGIARDTRVQTAPIDIGPKLSARTWPGLALRWPAHLRRLRAALEAHAPYDVLLLHFKKEQLLAPRLPPELRATTAWCEWGPVPHPLRRGLPGRLYANAAREVGAVLCVSTGTAETVVAAGAPAGRVHVVPNVVRTEAMDLDPAGRTAVRAELGIGEEELVVGCISRLHRKKPNDVLVDAVLALEDPRVHLLMAGEGETEAELRARAAPLGRRFHLVPTPWDRTAAVLSASDIVAFAPSPTEGQPLAVVNGLLCRRPVVATGAEGVRDLLPEGVGGIAEPEHDPAAVATLLRSLLDDRARRAAEGERGRAHVLRTLGPDAVAARAERLLAGAAGVR